MTKFYSNVAIHDGDAIATSEGSIIVNMVVFVKNTAKNNGGALRTSIVSGLASESLMIIGAWMNRGIFQNNKAINGSGGATHAIRVTLAVNECNSVKTQLKMEFFLYFAKHTDVL